MRNKVSQVMGAALGLMVSHTLIGWLVHCRGTFTINGLDHEDGLNGHLPETLVSVRGWHKGLM